MAVVQTFGVVAMARIALFITLDIFVHSALATAVAAGPCSAGETADEVASAVNLSGKVVIVTGGDSGLGHATAETMAKKGATVIIATHNLSKGRKAAQDIVNTTGGVAYAHLMDLASFASIRSFAKKFTQDFEGRLDILFNNAGISGFSNTWFGHFVDSLTEDGFEEVFQVNYLGHFLLSELLLPNLRKNKGRIVNTASLAHTLACSWAGLPENCLSDWTHIPPVPLSGHLPWNKKTWYGLSKMMQIQHAQELAARESMTGVTAFSLCPGFVTTGMVPEGPQWYDKMMYSIMCAGMKREHQEVCPYSSQQGAAVTVYVGVQAQATHSGAYYTRYSGCQRANITMNGFEPAMRSELYEKSLKWVGLSESGGSGSFVV